MPRQLRQLEVGEIYHVMNRGVEKRDIFLKPQDYARFILGLEFFNSSTPVNLWELIAPNAKHIQETKPSAAQAGPGPAEAVKNEAAGNAQSIGGQPSASGAPDELAAEQSDTTWLADEQLLGGNFRQRLHNLRAQPKQALVELLAFCLMPNHFHLVLREINNGGISAFMRKITGYAGYFNKQHKRVGPLFQGRYKAVHVKKESQLDVLFAYVHTNPVELWQPGWRKQGVNNIDTALAKLRTYRWSSWPDYLGQVHYPQVSQREFFLEYFGSAQRCTQAVREWLAYKGHELDFVLD